MDRKYHTTKTKKIRITKTHSARESERESETRMTEICIDAFELCFDLAWVLSMHFIIYFNIFAETCSLAYTSHNHIVFCIHFDSHLYSFISWCDHFSVLTARCSYALVLQLFYHINGPIALHWLLCLNIFPMHASHAIENLPATNANDLR